MFGLGAACYVRPMSARMVILWFSLAGSPALAAGSEPESRAEGQGPHELKPLSFALVDGFGAPTGLMGATLDYAFRFPWVGELGFGLGASGYQISARGRYVWLPGPLRKFAWFVAGGPSAGMLSELLGTRVPHRDDQKVGPNDVYLTAWMNAGGGLEMRWDIGFLLRTELGFAVRMFSNADDLCRGVDGNPETPGESSCKSYHIPTAPEVGRLPAFPYGNLSFGWAL